MRILVIDDESRKHKRICGITNRIDGITNNDVDTVLCLSDARPLMRNVKYDMVILDLKIDEELGNPSDSEKAGLEFIDEILEIDSIYTPIEIVLLTEFEELQRKYSSDVKYAAYNFLYYDESSCEWEDIIEKKIEYHLKREESEKVFSDQLPVDVAIICAVDNEMDAVKDAFFDGSEYKQTFNNDANNYYIVTKNTNGKSTKIVIAQQNEMGMVAASGLTQCINYHFSPKYIIMVGIAAGIGKNKNFGDIIAAKEVFNYASGKYVEEEDVISFKPDPKKLEIDTKLEQVLRNDYDDVLHKIEKKWKASDKPGNLKRIIGSLACGVAVVGSSKLVDDMITDHARKTEGLDMESYGMFYAAKYGINGGAKVLCLKSISDFADQDKDDRYQAYAAYTSTQFAKYLIENELQY